MSEKIFLAGLDIDNFMTLPYPDDNDDASPESGKSKVINKFNYGKFDWRLSISVLNKEELFDDPYYAKVIINSRLSFDAGESFAQVSTFGYIKTPENWDFEFCNSENFPKYFSENFMDLFVHPIWDYTRLAAVYVFPAYKNIMDEFLPKKTPEQI